MRQRLGVGFGRFAEIRSDGAKPADPVNDLLEVQGQKLETVNDGFSAQLVPRKASVAKTSRGQDGCNAEKKKGVAFLRSSS